MEADVRGTKLRTVSVRSINRITILHLRRRWCLKGYEAGSKYHERLFTLLFILIRLCIASTHDWKVRAPKVAVMLVTAYSRI
jgi:hypothetical protein